MRKSSFLSSPSPFKEEDAGKGAFAQDNRNISVLQNEFQAAADQSTENLAAAQLQAVADASVFGGVVQRVKTGDVVHAADGWTRITDETGDWMAYVEAKEVTILVPKADFDVAPDNVQSSQAVSSSSSGVNDVSEAFRSMGCSICVIADYFGMSVMEFLGTDMVKKNRRVFLHVKTIYKENGYSGAVGNLFNLLGIFGAIENFDTYDAMIASLTSDADGAKWSGALAWEGHIVRISGDGDTYRIWDPQSGSSDASDIVPRDKKLKLITFS